MEIIKRKRRICARCKGPLGFGVKHAWCNRCKKEWYKENKYGYRNKCTDCRTPSLLRYGKCKFCLARIGLRYCDGCNNMLIMALCFYSSDRSSKCKACRKKILANHQTERAKLALI